MADCPRAEPRAWLGVRTYRSAAGPAGDFGGDEGLKQLCSGECVPSASLPRPGSRMHPPGAGKVAVACVAVRDDLGDTVPIHSHPVWPHSLGLWGQEVQPCAQLHPSVWDLSRCVFVPVPSVSGTGIPMLAILCQASRNGDGSWGQ